MIEIYKMKLPDFQDLNTVKLLSYVSAERVEKILRLFKNEDKSRALMSELLIRSIIVKKFAVNNEQILIHRNAYGKPYISLGRDFHYNISHSGEWVLCAISHAEIGIDIEEIRPIEYMEIAREFFSMKENDLLKGLTGPARLECFFELWTLKEAYIKAVGKGMGISLSSFTMSKNDSGDYICELFNYKPQNYQFQVMKISDSYIGAVCSSLPFKLADITSVDFRSCVQCLESSNS
ncbi:4'-phosphopantetheinyl transferase family protein [Mesobacillus foraminis]|uniref:4'-phosphopantetheinyl transferase n=1 Tax=Mesobacillus foraminis TaxID=279826 RepID=A0A4R2BGT1_9BACI|nr:4'-phosphopantetheinyl transferase superfamily protein [Mesobacillus foraminis]TCN25189.1 4'-phosphopantetheinyl transferase [Mesobacillus foraminis]